MVGRWSVGGRPTTYRPPTEHLFTVQLVHDYHKQLRTQNQRYIKNLSNKVLSESEVQLLSRHLKFIPTPTTLASTKYLLKDFNSFARSMRLRYKFADSKTTAHPFHVKSQWQPPPQPSVALETYLELTKMELAEAVFTPQSDNLSANERKALKELRTNSEINLKKADKGSTTDCHLRY